MLGFPKVVRYHFLSAGEDGILGAETREDLERMAILLENGQHKVIGGFYSSRQNLLGFFYTTPKMTFITLLHEFVHFLSFRLGFQFGKIFGRLMDERRIENLIFGKPA